jgi:hypothetical protein
MEHRDTLLETLAAECWRLLAAAPADRDAHARTPVLATSGLDGAPECRTVVLRVCDPERRTLTVFTDARSAKVAQIEADRRVSLTFHERDQGVQIRAWGTARLHADDVIARRLWEAAPALSRLPYLSVPGPGQVVAGPCSGLPAGDIDLETGYANFVALVITVHSMEWLKLERDGNLSARFRWDGARLAAAGWIIP